MRFCSKFNMTWVTIKFKESSIYFADKDGFLRGSYGDFMTRNVFLVEPEVAKKRCRFLWADTEGSYNPHNQSYGGAVAMVMESKADAYIRPINFFDADHRRIDYR